MCSGLGTLSDLRNYIKSPPDVEKLEAKNSTVQL